MNANVKIEPAAPADLQSVQRLLELERLPSEDVTEPLLRHFLVCRDASGVIGAVGLEPCGSGALLRSLVVAKDRRGEGFGARLVDAMESLAERAGYKPLYLLTTTAEQFFARRGYRVVSRADAPAEVRSSAQFSSLCPSSAVLMAKP